MAVYAGKKSSFFALTINVLQHVTHTHHARARAHTHTHTHTHTHMHMHT